MRSAGTRTLSAADMRRGGRSGVKVSGSYDDEDDEEGDAGEDGDGKEVVKATNALAIRDLAFSGSGSVAASK